MHEVDPNTGLRALPGEDFWRVRVVSDRYDDEIEYEIVRIHVSYRPTNWLQKLFGDGDERRVEVESGTFFHYFDSGKNLLSASLRAWELGEWSQKRKAKAEEDQGIANRIVGDYPPKKYEP